MPRPPFAPPPGASRRPARAAGAVAWRLPGPLGAAARGRRRERRRARTARSRRRFAPAVTLSQVLAREGFGAAGGQRHHGAREARRSEDDPGRPEVLRAPRRHGHARVLRVPAVGRPALHRRARGATAPGPRSKAEQAVETQTVEAGGVVESSLYESVQKAGESTTLVEPARRAVRVGRELLRRHAPGRSLEGRRREAAPGRQVLQVRHASWRPSTAARRAPSARSTSRAATAKATPGRYYDEHGQAIIEDHAQDAAALRAHQLEVRSQALPPHPPRREGAPGHRLRRARGHARLGVGRRPRRRGRDEARLGQHGRASRTRTASTRATTTCRASRAGCTPASSSSRRTSSASWARPACRPGRTCTSASRRTAPSSIPTRCRSAATPRWPTAAGFLDAIRPRLAALKNIQPGAVARN